MALIKCPECQREISDKVKTCPHCGYPLIDESATPQPVEVTSVNIGPKDPKAKKKLFVGGAVAVILVIGVIISVVLMNQHNATAARSEYIDNMKQIRAHMLSGGSVAEQMCNLTKSVWYNTIFEERDSKTDKYTMNNGKFNKDFNDSLSTLYGNSDAIAVVDGLKENRETVADLMSKLQNPPDDLKSCYSTVESMYDAYWGLTGLAISPSGSLKTYSEDFGTYDTDLMKYYEMLDSQIPQD